MTVNERLFEAGVIDQFEAAAKNRDADAMVRILMRVALTEKDARLSTDAILKNPERYGY
jgi:hypothetical protein